MKIKIIFLFFILVSFSYAQKQKITRNYSDRFNSLQIQIDTLDLDDIIAGATNVHLTTTLKSNYDAAYTDRLKWDGGATGLVAATGRASLDVWGKADSNTTKNPITRSFYFDNLTDANIPNDLTINTTKPLTGTSAVFSSYIQVQNYFSIKSTTGNYFPFIVRSTDDEYLLTLEQTATSGAGRFDVYDTNNVSMFYIHGGLKKMWLNGTIELGKSGGTSGSQTFVASDNDQANIAINTSDQLVFSGASWGYIFDGNVGHNSENAVTCAASATTFAITKNSVKVTGDAGGNTIATITGATAVGLYTFKFEDALVTITDTDAHTANTVDLSAAFTSADDTMLLLYFDGTSFYEVSRSVN